MLVWEWLEEPGLEVCVLSCGGDGVRQVAGHVVASWEGELLDLRYALQCDAGWNFQHADLTLRFRGDTRTLAMRHLADGWWIDGQHRPDLAAARDIDIMGTPLTNTLPIQRLDWPQGTHREFVMAYVRLPDLTVLPVQQRYTALKAEGRRFLYEGLESGFQAELTVDAEGLVLAYPPFWRRVSG